MFLCRPQVLLRGTTTIILDNKTDHVILETTIVRELEAMTEIGTMGNTGIETEARRGTTDGAPGVEVQAGLREALCVIARGDKQDWVVVWWYEDIAVYIQRKCYFEL